MLAVKTKVVSASLSFDFIIIIIMPFRGVRMIHVRVGFAKLKLKTICWASDKRIESVHTVQNKKILFKKIVTPIKNIFNLLLTELNLISYTISF